MYRELEAERRRLALGQVKLREFIREVTVVCNEELALLDRLPELPVEEEQPVQMAAPAARQTQEAPPPVSDTKVLPVEPAAVSQPVAAVSEEESSPPAAVAAFAPAAAEEADMPQGDPFAEDSAPAAQEDVEATRVLNLEDLQFGRNYVKD